MNSIIDIFNNIWDQLRASFAPASCVNCELIMHEESLCNNCFKLVKPVLSTVVAGECRTTIPVEAVGQYEGPLANLVYQKYKNNKHAFVGAANLIYESQLKFINADIIVPIPLNAKKARLRGFDQVEIMAKSLAELANIDYSRALIRTRDTAQQSNLNKSERLTNVANAFELTRPEVIKDKNVILLDDVYTTGSTAFEACKTIISAKPKSLKVLVLARSV
jgi:competence protein ComFC